jgi:hypothetical protein
LPRLIDVVHGLATAYFKSYLLHGRFEFFTFFGFRDHLGSRTNHFDAVFFQHSVLG